MTYKLYNYLRDVPGFTFAEMAILKDLASISKDDQTVTWSMENLCKSAHCSVRTARRNLRRIEEKNGLISQGESRGRGHVLSYRFNVGYNAPGTHPPVESVPVVQPDHTPPATNGHTPAIPPPADFTVKSDAELLADLRKTLQARLQQQAQREKPSTTLDHLIESTKRKIAKLEQELEGEHEASIRTTFTQN